jgi:hypothetical protein
LSCLELRALVVSIDVMGFVRALIARFAELGPAIVCRGAIIVLSPRGDYSVTAPMFVCSRACEFMLAFSACGTHFALH